MLEDTILKAAPKATAVEKYGGLLYTLNPAEKEGQFCGVFEYTNHVQLAIGFGPQLDDPKNILQGTGKTEGMSISRRLKTLIPESLCLC